ncbi:MAG: SIR2 family protein [Candidatus Goldbacteria bacterium]|nr:SIR2 family protein [Candidatus Goldiibacteriota bacterium]
MMQNEQYNALINDLLEAEKFCLFLGAGFSKQLGFWLWDELVTEIIEKFEEEKLTFSDKEHLIRIDKKYALDYLESLNKNYFYELLDRIYKEKEKNKNTAIINSMLYILTNEKFKIITTNFDNVLEKQLSIEKVGINPNFDINNKINYIHGRIDEKDSLILTQKKYFENYLKKDSELIKFLHDVFQKHVIFFIGYSLSDYEILQILNKTKQNGINRYILLPEYKNNESYISILKKIYEDNFNLTLLKYNIDKNGYNALIDYLKELDDALYKKQKSQNTMEEPENAK